MTKLQKYLLDSLDSLFKNNKEVAEVSDILFEWDIYNRNNIDNFLAEEFLQEYKIDLWDFISGYVKYCNNNFGGYQYYQGDNDNYIQKNKVICLWLGTFFSQNIEKITEKEKVSKNKFYNEAKKYIQSKWFLLIEDHYFD